MKENENKTLLAVLAHPDDESFGMGGTLAYYASQGVQVHLVCATRGEAGTVDPEYMDGYKSIAELREAELRCAAGVLGLAGVHLLGYRDSGMPGTPENEHPNALVAQPLDEVAAEIACYIRELRPQVVLTFDPVGGYHHPDHIAVHQATMRAFHAAGDPEQFLDGPPPHQPEKLYYNVFPRGVLRLAVKVMKLLGRDPTKFGRNQDIDLEMLVGDEDYPPHVRVNYRSVAERKQAAANCHASQLQGLGSQDKVLDFFMRLVPPRDTFSRAHPPAPDGLRLKDLFEG